MKRTFVALVAALLVLSGCGSDDPPEPEKTTRPVAGRQRQPSRRRPHGPTGARDLVVEPGRRPASGRHVEGRRAEDWAVRRRRPAAGRGCPPYPLQWKKQYKGLDVLTRDDGRPACSTPTSRRRSRAAPPYPLKWKKKYKGVDVLTR